MRNAIWYLVKKTTPGELHHRTHSYNIGPCWGDRGGGLMARKQDPKRRDFLKKAAYSAPVVLTLQATSGVAKAGSEKPTSSPKVPKEIKPPKPPKSPKSPKSPKLPK
jgi:hypothetical protein